MAFDVGPAAALYCQTAGVLAGFAFAGVLLLLSDRRRTAHTSRALELLVASCMGFALASFLYAELAGDAAVLQRERDMTRDRHQAAARSPFLALTHRSSNAASRGQANRKNTDGCDRVSPKVGVLISFAGVILGICATQLFAAIRLLLVVVGQPGRFQVGGVCLRASQAVVAQQIGLLGFLGPGSPDRTLGGSAVIVLTVAVVVLVLLWLLAPGPLKRLKSCLLSQRSGHGAVVVAVICGLNGLAFGATCYLDPCFLSSTWASTLPYGACVSAVFGMAAVEASTIVARKAPTPRTRKWEVVL